MSTATRYLLFSCVLGIAVVASYRVGSQPRQPTNVPQPPTAQPQPRTPFQPGTTHPNTNHKRPQPIARQAQPQPPKHRFEFKITYEGQGFVDDSVVELVKAQVNAALAQSGGNSAPVVCYPVVPNPTPQTPSIQVIGEPVRSTETPVGRPAGLQPVDQPAKPSVLEPAVKPTGGQQHKSSRLNVSSNPNRPMKQVLLPQKGWRQIEDEWERDYFLDQPSHLKYERIHGGIE